MTEPLTPSLSVSKCVKVLINPLRFPAREYHRHPQLTLERIGAQSVCPPVCVYACVHVCARARLCTTLCDPMDYSLQGFSVQGIFQTRLLKWGSKKLNTLVKVTEHILCLCLFNSTLTSLEAESLPDPRVFESSGSSPRLVPADVCGMAEPGRRPFLGPSTISPSTSSDFGNHAGVLGVLTKDFESRLGLPGRAPAQLALLPAGHVQRHHPAGGDGAPALPPALRTAVLRLQPSGWYGLCGHRLPWAGGPS